LTSGINLYFTFRDYVYHYLLLSHKTSCSELSAVCRVAAHETNYDTVRTKAYCNLVHDAITAFTRSVAVNAMCPWTRATYVNPVKPDPHQQQRRSNVRLCRRNIQLCSIRQCCFDSAADVDGVLQSRRLRLKATCSRLLSDISRQIHRIACTDHSRFGDAALNGPLYSMVIVSRRSYPAVEHQLQRQHLDLPWSVAWICVHMQHPQRSSIDRTVRMS